MKRIRDNRMDPLEKTAALEKETAKEENSKLKQAWTLMDKARALLESSKSDGLSEESFGVVYTLENNLLQLNVTLFDLLEGNVTRE